MNTLTLPLVIFGALGDSVNPCAIAVLVFLVTFLMSLKVRGKKFLSIGAIYILFVYLTYFFAGLGLLTIVRGIGVTKLLYYFAALIVLFAGLVNLKDAFWEGKGISLAIPKSAKPIIQKYIKAASIPAAIMLGILVSLFELPCTGGIYIAIIGLLAEQATKIQGILYLLLYNFIFVLPLIIILIISLFGFSNEKLNAWRKKNKKTMKLIMGVTMILLGILMISA